MNTFFLIGLGVLIFIVGFISGGYYENKVVERKRQEYKHKKERKRQHDNEWQAIDEEGEE